MSDYFIGEIRMFAFNWAPENWALCNGATMQIQQNKALYSLIGTIYGGNATTVFNLPDLRGRVPLCDGAKSPFRYQAGNTGGLEGVALTTASMPAHIHPIQASTVVGTKSGAAGNYFGTTAPATSTDTSTHPVYTSSPSNITPLNAAMIASTGSGQAHENRQPYTVANFCISTVGLYPTRQ
ncbi:MAG TPA: tail fiber protein [Magnetospirillum sp.]|nr:tail fiber protein [Magnetospirillum sp.]